MKFMWPESARAEVRGIDRDTAIRILLAPAKYGDSREGDVKALVDKWLGYFRLRVGDYRVIFSISPKEIAIVRVRHRSNVYS
jgi:mRNA-degrading endonuclease RelE of RelBE toxin-antitoxin system